MSENTLDAFKLEIPLNFGGSIPEDKTIFYDFARKNIVYQTRAENRDWQQKYLGKVRETTATYVIGADNVVAEEGDVSRYVHTLSIVVNKGLFEDIGRVIGENCLDLVPYEVEHEIYEAWLSAKKGVGQNLSVEKKHSLARRRQFYLAVQNGLGDKVYRFNMAINPVAEAEYKDALEYAKRRLSVK